ncbi:MAG: vWA domain-containing protein [Gemmataceae bacterium]
MPRTAKPGWTVRAIAAPLLLSLTLHVLLLLALWFWPTRTLSPTLTIASTRITLDTCVLDPRSSTLLPAPELPPDLRGPNVNTTLAPQLQDPLPFSPRTSASAGPASPGPSDQQSPSSPPQGEGDTGGGGSLFPLPATAASVVYAIDRSVSMGMGRKLDFARRELIASLRRLPAATRFQVIDYNECAQTLVVDGQRDLLPAEPAIINKAIALLQTLDAAGTTNHLLALRRGVDLHPDVLYFLTDADDLKADEVSYITRRNQRTVIHTIELTRRRSPTPEDPLAQLARDNHGTYRRVSLGDPVNSFSREP